MAKTHKAQHYVPRCYLSAWIDPASPREYEPYVWVFPRNGGKGRRKAPKNIFTENEMYTIHHADGKRDLRVERGLHQLEDWFLAIRRDFLEQHKNIPSQRRVKLMAFVAASGCRTTAFRDHHRTQWQAALDLMEEMQQDLSNMTLEEREQFRLPQFSSSTSSSNKGMSIEDVRKLVKEPVQHLIPEFLDLSVPIMAQMSIRVLCTNTKPGFISSDNPTVWFDPEAKNRPFLYNSPGLAWPTLEITMPLSPKQLLFITHHKERKEFMKPVQYLAIEESLVHELNRRTRASSDAEIVVNQNYTHPHWFNNDIPQK